MQRTHLAMFYFTSKLKDEEQRNERIKAKIIILT